MGSTKRSASERQADMRWGTWKGKQCSVDGCGEPAKCKGMCNRHYHKDRWDRGIRPPSCNHESQRRAHLRHRYGIEVEHYETLLKKQRGKCAICKRPPSEENTRPGARPYLCIDHDHSTGEVRGLLCNDCNIAIGRIRTSKHLDAAAAYLRSYRR